MPMELPLCPCFNRGKGSSSSPWTRLGGCGKVAHVNHYRAAAGFDYSPHRHTTTTRPSLPRNRLYWTPVLWEPVHLSCTLRVCESSSVTLNLFRARQNVPLTHSWFTVRARAQKKNPGQIMVAAYATPRKCSGVRWTEPDWEEFGRFVWWVGLRL